MQRRRWCTWHWLPRQPIPVQEAWAQWRRDHPQAKPDKAFFETYTAWRWCSGCSWVVPKDYCTGSRCKACSRAATRASHVRRTYGLSGDDERALLALQGGRCAICRKQPRSRNLAVDHSHDSGVVRGLLCTRCNHDLLGAANDSVAVLRAALQYLENPPTSGRWVAPDPS